MRPAIPGVVAALLLSAAATLAQDYEREKRWADEVVPGVVVGDAVWLEASGGRKFLGLYAPAKTARPALVIVHGIGVHPDHGMIGVLRAKLTDLGYPTLSTTRARSRQVMIPGADHFYAKRETELAAAIDAWLREAP